MAAGRCLESFPFSTDVPEMLKAKIVQKPKRWMLYANGC